MIKQIVLVFIFLTTTLKLIQSWFIDKKQINVLSKILIKYKDKDIAEDIKPTPADLQILQDKDIHYRVFDLARDPFNDNTSAKFHRLIGGYHPAKLSRYQDLIANQIAKQNQNVLDMLNNKYNDRSRSYE